MERVDICYNGEQSSKLMENAIRENDIDRYSLILTDCSMPFMDGYEATKRMRKSRELALRLSPDKDLTP